MVCIKAEEKQETGVSELMEKILERENMIEAYRKVKAKKGAAGIDGIEVEGIDEYLRKC